MDPCAYCRRGYSIYNKGLFVCDFENSIEAFRYNFLVFDIIEYNLFELELLEGDNVFTGSIKRS
jgi:hypothetical protein